MEIDVHNPEMGMETLHHLKLEADGLDKDLVYPFRAIIEAAIKEENKEWSLLKNILAAFFATRMREYGNRKPKYTQYVKGVNELGVMAQEGKKVNTIINTLVFDYQKLWIGIDKLSKGKIFKNKKHYEQLELYPVTNFAFDLKKHFLYQVIEETFPGLMRILIKNKLMVYVTSDFHLAVNSNILQLEGVPELVKMNKCGEVVQLNDTTKLYLFEGI